MLKPGGLLVVIEPTFSPAPANTVLFYVKKLVTRVASGRIELLGHGDNNICRLSSPTTRRLS